MPISNDQNSLGVSMAAAGGSKKKKKKQNSLALWAKTTLYGNVFGQYSH